MSLKFSNAVFWSDPKRERNNNQIFLLSIQRLTQTQPRAFNQLRAGDPGPPAFAGVTGSTAADSNQLWSHQSDG
jgi:hypothetical protein